MDGDSVASCFISFGLWKDIHILISVFNNTFVSDYQQKSVYEFHQNHISVCDPFRSYTKALDFRKGKSFRRVTEAVYGRYRFRYGWKKQN